MNYTHLTQNERGFPPPSHLEGGNLLGSSQSVDRPLRDLQVVGDLLDGEDLALAGTFNG